MFISARYYNQTKAGTVSAVLTVGFAHARYPSGNRTSIWVGRAATIALFKAKLLLLDHHPFRTGFNYSSRLGLRHQGKNPPSELH